MSGENIGLRLGRRRHVCIFVSVIWRALSIINCRSWEGPSSCRVTCTTTRPFEMRAFWGLGYLENDPW